MRAPLLNFDGGSKGPTFKLGGGPGSWVWISGSPGPGSWGPGPTFTPCWDAVLNSRYIAL